MAAAAAAEGMPLREQTSVGPSSERVPLRGNYSAPEVDKDIDGDLDRKCRRELLGGIVTGNVKRNRDGNCDGTC